MLFLAFFSMLFSLLSWVLDFFPAANVDPAGWWDTARMWVSSAMVLDSALPITEIFSAMGIYGGFYLGAHGGSAMRRLWSLISGGGGV